jgi:hypothetical protein
MPTLCVEHGVILADIAVDEQLLALQEFTEVQHDCKKVATFRVKCRRTEGSLAVPAILTMLDLVSSKKD